MEALVFIIVGTIAAFAGLHYGRRGSAIAIGICLGIVVVMSIVAHLLLAQSGHHGWQVAEGHPWGAALGVGMLALFAGLGFTGPALFERRWIALAVSAIVLVGIVFTQIPLLYVGCLLFGACP